jgi:hypothetical protein
LSVYGNNVTENGGLGVLLEKNNGAETREWGDREKVKI